MSVEIAQIRRLTSESMNDKFNNFHKCGCLLIISIFDRKTPAACELTGVTRTVLELKLVVQSCKVNLSTLYYYNDNTFMCDAYD